jgi:hypothetical protein
VNRFNNGIAFFLLSSVFSTLLPTEQKLPSKFVKQALHVVKTISKITAGIGLALGAHILTELPICYCHEYGHYVGNRLTGGKGGKVSVECNLHKHPLAVFMPFFAMWSHAEKYGNEIAHLSAGPLTGMAINYGIMAIANTLHEKTKGTSNKTAVKKGLTSPWNAYKDLANEVTHIIVERSNYQTLSFSEIFMMTFNILKTSKMFGEFLYGLTPISIDNGDGKKLWETLGFKKDYTVKPLVGFGLALIPFCTSIAFGTVKGIYLSIKSAQ